MAEPGQDGQWDRSTGTKRRRENSTEEFVMVEPKMGLEETAPSRGAPPARASDGPERHRDVPLTAGVLAVPTCCPLKRVAALGKPMANGTVSLTTAALPSAVLFH